MSTPSPAAPAGDMPALPPPIEHRADDVVGPHLLDDVSEQRFDAIEMIGEEQAANLPPPGVSGVTPGMRYLHASRTINQLVTDRNRSVGIYLAVASLLYTASTALLHAQPAAGADFLVPLELLQRWCLPVTFAILAVLALFVGLLLIRTRVGLIYEVAKMNVLLGLPSGRVQRVNPLSVFFLMHLLISTAGGLSAALFAFHLLYRATDQALLYSVLIGCGVVVLLVVLYVGGVWYTTTDEKLRSNGAALSPPPEKKGAAAPVAPALREKGRG